MVHFDNSPIHNTQGIQEHLASVGFTKMEHPTYSPDPAPCDSFLFGAMKRNSSGQHFESVEGLLLALEALLEGLSADFLQTVFPEWERQLQACCESGREYAERRLQNYMSTFPITCAGYENCDQHRAPCIPLRDIITK